ncbi:MAG: hypothetical protein K0S11_1296 [Gammaproteobacteria bacterium]|jgi:heme exporter protein D|nr:hypothetical protein [Gammaproteobacteria bacterium]
MKILHNFLTMGGYAAYVWPAYAVTLLILMGNTIGALRNNRKILKKLKQQLLVEKRQ